MLISALKAYAEKEAGQKQRRKPVYVPDKRTDDHIARAVISAEHGFAKQQDDC
jgi:hypothetical protein